MRHNCNILRFELSHVTPALKGLNNLVKLFYMCSSLINHFNSQKFLYITESYPLNPNLVISVLYHHLYSLMQTNTTRSKILHIQLDNCSGQNKNRFIMAFCSFLVLVNWFSEVHLSFLLSGELVLAHLPVLFTFTIA